jgi:hypothetical protein
MLLFAFASIQINIKDIQVLLEPTYIIGLRKESGVSERHFSPPVLKVPRQCPLVLLIEIRLRQGKSSRK